MTAPARNLLDVARRINAATLIEPLREPVELPDLKAAVARIRELVAGRPFSLTVATTAYPDFDPFPAISVKVGGFAVAYLADRWHDEGDARAALRILEASL